MISGVVVTKNSEHELGACLESLVGFADEIVIVDLESTDNTKRVASEFGAKVYEHKPVQYVELVRQFAINKASGDWIILLDPDERLTEGLRQSLRDIGNQVHAVNIPRKNIFFEKWISHANFWPDRQIRFFKKDSISWPVKIHTYPIITGEVLQLDAKPDLAIEHFGYANFSEFFERQNRYSTIEAQNLYESGTRFNWVNLFWKPKREFLVRFVKHMAFLDGALGVGLVYGLMIYQLMVQIKLWQKSHTSG